MFQFKMLCLTRQTKHSAGYLTQGTAFRKHTKQHADQVVFRFESLDVMIRFVFLADGPEVNSVQMEHQLSENGLPEKMRTFIHVIFVVENSNYNKAGNLKRKSRFNFYRTLVLYNGEPSSASLETEGDLFGTYIFFDIESPGPKIGNGEKKLSRNLEEYTRYLPSKKLKVRSKYRLRQSITAHRYIKPCFMGM